MENLYCSCKLTSGDPAGGVQGLAGAGGGEPGEAAGPARELQHDVRPRVQLPDEVGPHSGEMRAAGSMVLATCWPHMFAPALHSSVNVEI